MCLSYGIFFFFWSAANIIDLIQSRAAKQSDMGGRQKNCDGSGSDRKTEYSVEEKFTQLLTQQAFLSTS